MFNVYAELDGKKQLANSFQNEVIAQLYVAGFKNYVAENYPTKDVILTIVEE